MCFRLFVWLHCASPFCVFVCLFGYIMRPHFVFLFVRLISLCAPILCFRLFFWFHCASPLCTTLVVFVTLCIITLFVFDTVRLHSYLYNNWRYCGVRRATFGLRHQFCKWLCLNDQAYNCLIHFRGSSGTAQGQLWETTYDGRRLMIEDDLWWKTTYDGRRLMI